MENKMNIENENLQGNVSKDTPIKNWLVHYVGKDYESEIIRAETETEKKLEWDGSVTVEMIVESMVKEFPEFVMALAEENFIRGYRQAMDDIGVAVPKMDNKE
jgi:hypothetical protein